MAKAKQDEEHRKKAMIRDAVLTSEHLKVLITHLRPAETPLEAIGRLGKSQRKVLEFPARTGNQAKRRWGRKASALGEVR